MALAQGPKHHLRVPNQYMGGGLSVKGFKGCGLVLGRKEIYSVVLVETPFEKMLCWDDIFPERVNTSWDHLMPAIGVGIGNGQATNKLVGSPREMPITNQKWLVQPKGQK